MDSRRPASSSSDFSPSRDQQYRFLSVRRRAAVGFSTSRPQLWFLAVLHPAAAVISRRPASQQQFLAVPCPTERNSFSPSPPRPAVVVSRRPAGRRPAVVVSRRQASSSSSSSSGSRRLLSSHFFVFFVRLIFLKMFQFVLRFLIAYGDLTLKIVLKL